MSPQAELVRIRAGTVWLIGELERPDTAPRIVLFAHASGGGRHRRPERTIASALRRVGLGTLHLDLLTPEEQRIDASTHHLRNDVDLLGARLMSSTEWLDQERGTASASLGCFGSGTGAGASLIAASQQPNRIAAVVSHGGRPDLAGPALQRVIAPTLMIAGGDDVGVLGRHRDALASIHSSYRELVVFPGASRNLEDPTTLVESARLACDWFSRHLGHATPPAVGGERA